LNVTKSSLALVTIVSAIPGAVLVYVLVMALLSSFGDMPTMFLVLVGTALICAAIAAVLPVGVMLFGGTAGAVAAPAAKAAKPVKEAKGKKEEAVAATATDAEMEVVDEEAEIADDELGADFDDDLTEGIVTDEEIVVHTGTGQSTGELDVVEGAFTEDNLPKFEAEVSDENIQVFDGVEEEFDGFEIPDDEEDDTPPKKKR
jgi:hypothetical protein